MTRPADVAIHLFVHQQTHSSPGIANTNAEGKTCIGNGLMTFNGRSGRVAALKDFAYTAIITARERKGKV